MLKSIPYFGIRQVYLAGDGEALHEILLKTHPGLNFGPPPFDLVYLPAPDPVFLAREGPDPLPWHNDTLCVLDRIHLSHQNTECWEKVKSLPQVRVTIDAFHCGLVFFRREQAEQHFKIRI